MALHLTEETYRLLASGEDFPGAEELAAHLETTCAECEAFIGNRSPTATSAITRPVNTAVPTSASASAPTSTAASVSVSGPGSVSAPVNEAMTRPQPPIPLTEVAAGNMPSNPLSMPISMGSAPTAPATMPTAITTVTPAMSAMSAVSTPLTGQVPSALAAQVLNEGQRPLRPVTGARLARSMRTENLAIVFTDIKGFTERTSRQTRAEHERLLKVHEMLLAPTFKAFGGNIRKTIGDAFLVTFESPTNAVLCGIAIQDRLFRFNQTAPEADRMEVRVAINIGEVRVEANDVFGEPVNVAARLEGVAEANEVYFTEAVYLVMNKAEVPSEEIGAFDFKGVPEKIRVFRVPRGPYRLTSGPLSNVPEPDLPYGGLGLARAEGLSPPDLVSIEKALAARQNRRANLHWLAERSRSLAEKVPGGKSTLMLGGVGTTLLLVLVLSLTMFSSPKVQKLIEAGEFNEAGALINQMPKGPERSYWDGRLQQKQSHWSAAVEDYGAAAQAKEFRHKAIDGLGEVAEHGDCDAKERVARKLGSIGDKYGSSILEKLAKESPEEPSGGVLGGLFGNPCDPAKAAAEAAKKLGDK